MCPEILSYYSEKIIGVINLLETNILSLLTPRVIAASGATCGSIITLNTVSIRGAPGGACRLAFLVDAVDGAIGAAGAVRVSGARGGAGGVGHGHKADGGKSNDDGGLHAEAKGGFLFLSVEEIVVIGVEW